MKNQTLYQSFRDLCLKGFDLVSQHRGTTNDIYELSEYSSFLQNVKDDSDFSKHFGREILVGTFLGLRNISVLFIPFVMKKFIKNGGFNNTLTESIYTEIEKMVYSEKKLPIKAIVPLDNFDTQNDNIELDQGLSIRKIADEEIEDLGIEKWKYVIELRKFAPKVLINTREQEIRGEVFQWPEELSQAVISDLLLPLRIFRKGSIGCRMLLVKVDLDLPFESKKKNIKAHARNAETYFLEGKKVSDLQLFYSMESLMDTIQDYLRSSIRKAIYINEPIIRMNDKLDLC